MPYFFLQTISVETANIIFHFTSLKLSNSWQYKWQTSNYDRKPWIVSLVARVLNRAPTYKRSHNTGKFKFQLHPLNLLSLTKTCLLKADKLLLGLANVILLHLLLPPKSFSLYFFQTEELFLMQEISKVRRTHGQFLKFNPSSPLSYAFSKLLACVQLWLIMKKASWIWIVSLECIIFPQLQLCSDHHYSIVHRIMESVLLLLKKLYR